MNTPVIVKLRSKDVIHSFGVPEFRVKQDAVPGLTIPIWFVPNVTTAEMRTRTGNPEFQYEIACAQLCGLGHYRMRGFVTVLSAEEFQKWMDGRRGKAQGRRTSAAARALIPASSSEATGVLCRVLPEDLRRRHPRADPLELLDGDAADAVLAAGSSTALTTIPRTNAGIFFMRAAAASSHAIVVGDSRPYSIDWKLRLGLGVGYPCGPLAARSRGAARR